MNGGRREVYKKLIMVIITYILIFAVIIILAFFGIIWKWNKHHEEHIHNTLNSRKFDQNLWMSDLGRVDMYNDLRANYLYIGIPKDQVTTLLGKPHQSIPGEDCYSTSKTCFNYPLGIINTVGMYSRFYLCFCLNSSNNIVETIELIEK